MKIKVDSKITIQDINKEVLEYCNKQLFLPNPDVQKKKAMGFWTGNLQKNIKLFTKKGNDYILPIGCIKDVWNLHPYKEDYIVNFGQHNKIEYPKLKFELFPYQKAAVDRMVMVRRGILQAPCGSGKSICAVEIVRRIGYKAIVIVQTMEILNQFKNYFLNVMGLDKTDIGIIAAGKVEIGNKVTLALRQTLCNVDLLQYKNEWGCIIIDECQNISSNPAKITQYEKILNNLCAEYRISLSATPKRMDGMTKAMLALCGKVEHIISQDDVKDKTIKADIQPIYTKYEIPICCQKFDGTILYTQLSSNMAINEERNKLIIDLLQKEKNNYCLILSDRLEGLEILHKKIGGLFVNGKMTSKKAKQEREEAIEKMREKKEHYLFATYSLAKEGLDIKSLNRLFLIAPTKNSNVLVQSIGRIERKDEGKQTPICYDIIDDDIYFEKAWKTRKGIYKKNNNKILD